MIDEYEMSQYEKVMIFIDGSNLFRGFKDNRPDIKYSINKLIELLRNDRRLIRPYYFSAEQVPPQARARRFFDGLRYDGIDVTIRPLKNRTKSIKCPQNFIDECIYNYQVEKGVDVSLVTRMLSFGFRNVYDTAIIVSGDADFIEAIEELRNYGKRVEICSFNKSISPGLRKIADEYISLDDIAEKIRK